MKAARGVCSVCGREMSRRVRDGAIRDHADLRQPTNGLPRHPRCEGADQQPARLVAAEEAS